LFEAWAETEPARVAIDSDAGVITYGELDGRAESLACRLVEAGVNRGDLVGLCLKPGADAIVALVAVLKAGAAYAPLDFANPQERFTFMLQDMAPSAIVTEPDLVHRLRDYGGAQLFVAPPAGCVQQHRTPREELAVGLTDLAYCMYSSGSTGRPKGILTTHEGIVHLARTPRYAHIEANDAILHAAPLAFDASTFEIWGALLNGARIVLPPPGPVSLDAIVDTVERHRVTTLWLTAALFHRLCDTGVERLSGLRQLLVGGDVVQPDRVTRFQRHLPECQVINGYGPTETTTFAACYSVPHAFSADTLPIGYAVGRGALYVLDERLRPVDPGVPGELYIGGPGLARGYLNRPQLTAEKFVPNPFGAPGSRLYRSGDIARRSVEGLFEFLGRVDHQVKINGFRVELGEVQAALLQHPQLREAVVHAPRTVHGGRELVAYLVPTPAGAPTVNSLRECLEGLLPDYMVPSTYVFLDALPLNASGKVNRAALPVARTERASFANSYAAPRDELEALIAQEWAAVLSIDAVGRDDRFRNLGGSSIQSIDVASRVRERVGLGRSALLHGNVSLAEYAEQVRVACAYVDDKGTTESNGRQAPPVASYAQQQVAYLEEIDDAWRAYRFHARLVFKGILDERALRAALRGLLQRHEILRTGFVFADEHLLRDVATEVSMPFEVTDLSGLEESFRDAQLSSIEARELGTRFNPAKPPLLRWHLVRLDARHHVLLQSEHHHLHDGQSFRILLRDLAELYNAERAGRTAELPPVSAQFSQFCVEEAGSFGSQAHERNAQAWAERLADTPHWRIFDDRLRHCARRFVGAQIRASVSRAMLVDVDQAAAKLGVSRFTFFLTAYALLCGNLAGRDRFVIGTALANRPSSLYQSTVGMFVNMVPIAVALNRARTFADQASATADEVDFALSHGGIPLGEIVRLLGRSPEMRGQAPFDTAFSSHDSVALSAEFNGLSTIVHEALPNGSSKFDLSVVVIAGNPTREGALELMFEYDTDIFDRAFVAGFIEDYLELLGCATASPGTALAELARPGPAQRSRMLAFGGDRGGPARPEPEDVIAVFARQASATPDAIAVICDGKRTTYRELRHRVDRVAAKMASLGIGRDRLVAICTRRDVDLVVATLATLQAGAAFMPLDLGLPRDRLEFMLLDSRAAAVLTHRELLDQLPSTPAPVLLLDAHDELTTSIGAATQPLPQQLAYCIYTSGSTGRPKGVLIPRGALNHHFAAYNELYGLRPSDVVLLFASSSFDVSIEQMFPPLLCGAACAIRPDRPWLPSDVVEHVVTHGITVAGLPPAYWRSITSRELELLNQSSLRLLIVGGDTMTSHDSSWGEPRFDVVNAYGPTEASITSTLNPDAGRCTGVAVSIPIGRPYPGTIVRLLDATLQSVAVGVTGEIYIAGNGLARGYLARPGLTAQHFLPDPLGVPGSRMYRTGDLARWKSDGLIDFVGRVDHQIKVRGFRIELSEIEAVLIAMPEVCDAVVVGREDASGEKSLVAYVTTSRPVTVPTLSAALEAWLPSHMLPSHLIVLDALPLNASGKVDRAALPEPARLVHAEAEDKASPGEQTLPAHVALVLDIAKHILVNPALRASDDLVRNGMHSMLMMRFAAQCRQRTGAQVRVRDIYRLGSAAAIAEHLLALTA
jgi:amino acid adenylation domain-containing protein